MSPTSSTSLSLLLVTRRDAVGAFFAGLPGVVADVVPPAAALDDAALDEVDLVAVDVAVEPDAATELCHDLHRRNPQLPVVAVLCCPQSVNPWQLESLLAGGVGSVLDLEASADEAVRTLEAAARGAFVLHLHLRRGQRRFLREVLVGHDTRREAKVRVLELISRGLSDREIGETLHLSPHTVKHQVEDLRREVGARNRTELAAWAGRHGFYRPEADDVVPVRLTH
jgi:DNA-binding NarL/FixJ family response regulator